MKTILWTLAAILRKAADGVDTLAGPKPVKPR